MDGKTSTICVGYINTILDYPLVSIWQASDKRSRIATIHHGYPQYTFSPVAKVYYLVVFHTQHCQVLW